jgi:subtilisin family serine protease
MTPRLTSVPGSLVVKMALGEAPETIPVSADVRRGRLAAAQTLDGGVVDRIVRHFAGGMKISRVHAAAANVAQPGARHRGFDDREQVFGLARTFRIDVPAGTAIAPLVDSLNQITTVEAASPNYLASAPFSGASAALIDDPVDQSWQPWETVRAFEALAHEPGDSAVIVAIIDSGVAPSHPDLPPVRSGFDTVQIGREDMGAALDLVGDAMTVDNRPHDKYVGHGMACAGIIGARGIGMPPGVAGAAQLLPMRALAGARFPGKPQPVGIGATTDLDMAVKMSVDLGAKVLNMSFGTDDAMLDPMAAKPHAEVVAYALDRGCVLIAASGNNGMETAYWPAAFPGVIAVGAVGANGRPTAFSTRGPHVALCAPGDHIRTLGLTGYQEVTGTSFAAPFAAATAALLVKSAVPFAGAPVNGCGVGVLDAAAALQALDAWIDETIPDAAALVEDG